MKHCKLVDILSNLNVKHKRKALLLTTFWPRFWFDVLFCDAGHAMLGLTNIANYSVQQFLCSFILFWTLDPTKYLHIPSWEPQGLTTPNSACLDG